MPKKKEIKKEDISFLIANKDSAKREQLMGALRTLGYKHFEQAPDGITAFHLLKRRDADFIFSGLEMPQMDGLSLLKIVSADDVLSKIPFFILTVAISRELVIEAGKYGIAGFLMEPVQVPILKKKIDEILVGDPDKKSEAVEEMYEKAKRLIDEGNYDESLALFKELLDVHENAEVYYNIGYIKSAQEKYDEALVAFRKAVTINNLHARAFKAMGEVYIKTGEPEKAEKVLEKAGEIFLEREMHEEAEKAFSEVLKINPSTTNVYNSLGISCRKQHKYKEAVRHYKMAIKVDPEDEHIHYNLSRTLLEDKQIEEAKIVLKRALQMNPNFSEASRLLQAIEVGF
ncbi:MAG: hypothetical protein IEMM0002_1193 [bacterium]|nr:MAG: hypothetical protein IEMM0002_1193 [bacterium]